MVCDKDFPVGRNPGKERRTKSKEGTKDGKKFVKGMYASRGRRGWGSYVTL